MSFFFFCLFFCFFVFVFFVFFFFVVVFFTKDAIGASENIKLIARPSYSLFVSDLIY